MNDLLRRLLFLPEQASTMAVEVDKLHYFVILTTMFASTVIGILAIYFMAHYRRRKVEQSTPHIESPRWLEALFIGVPLALFLVWFRIGFAQFVDMTTPPPDAMDVYVMGKKWMWKFAYPGGPNGLGILRVPADRPVRLLITSRDVIHSFYVPAFRIKQDALPGRYTQIWFRATKPGRYPVFCAEYCGTGHSTMRAEVDVLEGAEFDRWLATQTPAAAEEAPPVPANRLAQRDTAPLPTPGLIDEGDMRAEGRRLAAHSGCLKCHSIDGTRHIGPTWLDLYGRHEKLESGDTVLVDEKYITESMMEPKAKRVAGYPLVMPSFQGRLQAPETAAIVEYIKSLRTSVEERAAEGPAYEPTGRP